MDCPVCKTSKIKPVELEKNLTAAACEACGGYWVSSNNYASWLEKHGPSLPEKPFSEVTFEVKEAQEAKICPECRRILLKYKVGHGLDFYVDHCSGCGGVWLDKNEWRALKARNLHDEIHRIFSTSWQRQIKHEEMKEKLEALYVGRFGKADYEKAGEVREWIQKHPHKDALVAFLTEDDPYEI
jgi:Zn-finger nucleic acid-binding protein